MKEELVALFGGAKPTVRLYHELLKYMPLEERGIFFDRTFGLALSGWTDLSEPYRLFLVRLIKGKHSKKCTFYTLRFGCSFAAVNTIKPQLL